MSTGDMAALEQTSLARLDADFRLAERVSESRLVARLKARDLDAFDELVTLFERPVHSICYRLLGDAEEARDAAQETFIKVYNSLGSFRGESGLKTWIYRIAVNQAINQQRWWRRRHREQTVSLDLSRTDSRSDSEGVLDRSLPSGSRSPEQEAISHERTDRIVAALGQIRTEYRVALVLREIEELSYEEIAETLSISVGTVKSRIARGREELRHRMKDFI
jgi:RNA polymerase sigma-70 factor, ECF subfamily